MSRLPDFRIKSCSRAGSCPMTVIMDFLTSYVGKFDMYVEDDYAIFVRYCFQNQLDAATFRTRFEPKGGRFKLAS